MTWGKATIRGKVRAVSLVDRSYWIGNGTGGWWKPVPESVQIEPMPDCPDGVHPNEATRRAQINPLTEMTMTTASKLAERLVAEEVNGAWELNCDAKDGSRWQAIADIRPNDLGSLPLTEADAEAYAAELARRWNAHAGLVAACKAAKQCLASEVSLSKERRALVIVEAALAAAKEDA